MNNLDQSEIWKPIPGFEHYEISNTGRVKRVKTQTFTSLHVDKDGYQKVALYNPKTKKQNKFFIHRLICISFLPNPDNLPLVDHIDRNRKNNDLSNLRWVGYRENTINSKKGRTNTTSKYKGVYWRTARNCWIARVGYGGKIHSSHHKNEKEAAKAYNQKVKELHGEFAFQNEISDDEDE